MLKHGRWLLGVALFVLTAGSAFAQGPAPQHSDATWQASYFNNKTLSGTPVLQRSESSINYDWHGGSPAANVSANSFSARWTRYLDLAPASYRISATADDGVRVYVDGEQIINDWSDHSERTATVTRWLSGHHLFVVEYYENAYDACAKFSVTAVPLSISNWRAEYYNNPTLSGDPVLVRDDASVSFDWGMGSPAPGVPADNFSARWTRSLTLPAGVYHFAVLSDDGVRLWVNNHLLIDAWQDQAPALHSGDISLPAGSIPVKLEYYEHGYGAVVKLTYGLTDDVTGPRSVLVDSADTGFVKGGSVTAWHSAPEGIRDQMYWTWNNDWARANYNWARWYPALRPARYEVFAFVPNRYTTTSHARYWVAHAAGFTLRVVDQNAAGGQWVSLGTYGFRGTRGDYVSLSDVTNEPWMSRLIGFDAVKWEPR